MSDTPTTSTIFNLPPSLPFADALAAGLMKETKDAPETLSQYLILLPSRRACRNLQEAFLRQSDGVPIMLPRLSPIGDVDEEDLLLNNAISDIEQIPPAMPAIKRQALLSKLICALPNFANNIEAAVRLAKTLGQLMDQIYTENLDLTKLPEAVDQEDFADHWQVTVNFLEILSIEWPKILEKHGMIDGADRRNRLIQALNTQWQTNPPSHPVIVAGSTGSIPATSGLLKTISRLPKGCIILPGLDQNMAAEAWDMVEEGHPQNTLKLLLNHLESTRENVKLWPQASAINEMQKMREQFISHFMAPPDYTHEWQKIKITNTQKENLENSLKDVQLIECETLGQEAQIIALLIRETLEQDQKTIALITPNRHLARRVSTYCQKWGIKVDDSAGMPLHQTPIGIYLKSIMNAFTHNMAPTSLLSLLKNELCSGAGFTNFRKTVRSLDRNIMRGVTVRDIALDDEKYRDEASLLKNIDEIFAPLQKLFQDGEKAFFGDILKQHLHIAETLATHDDGQSNNLWQDDSGEQAAIFLSDLQTQIQDIPPCNASDYLGIFDHFIKSVGVRSKYGMHPRVMILGQLEARLIQTNRIIMAGLNEGTWPPDMGHDPWMSRPMRKNFGLPPAERGITLAAHDFTQGLCGTEVFLTRTKHDGGVATVPARWLQRMEALMKTLDINPNIIRTDQYFDYAHALDHANEKREIKRPQVTPPVSSRPTSLSVTQIETWMRDPYSIYAKHILKLKPLDPIEKPVGALERGNILHDTMEKFTEAFPKDVQDNAKHDFIVLAKSTLQENGFDQEEWNFWLPRLLRLSDWLIPQEQQWRQNARFGKSEIEGSIEISDNVKTPFTLKTRIDRIDYLKTGGVALIDYKSGGTYSVKSIENGKTPQLPLEAMILNHHGFENHQLPDGKVAQLSYWTMTGGKEAGKITSIDNQETLNTLIEDTYTQLTTLIATYEDEATPYIAIPRPDHAPRFHDFEHLERVKEWAALDDTSEEAA